MRESSSEVAAWPSQSIISYMSARRAWSSLRRISSLFAA
jgi:hypothetical protein